LSVFGSLPRRDALLQLGDAPLEVAAPLRQRPLADIDERILPVQVHVDHQQALTLAAGTQQRGFPIFRWRWRRRVVQTCLHRERQAAQTLGQPAPGALIAADEADHDARTGGSQAVDLTLRPRSQRLDALVRQLDLRACERADAHDADRDVSRFGQLA
jgi:hypothetical protein